jgi:hypothetical protein
VSKISDPREACAEIVSESYQIWLEHESRTDDITIIIVHIQDSSEVCTLLLFCSIILGIQPYG